MLNLCCYVQSFFSYGEWGLLSSCGGQSYCGGFGSCGMWAVECGLSSYGTGLVALRQVGSSQTRHQTCVPCIARILNHWTSREVLHSFCNFLFQSLR